VTSTSAIAKSTSDDFKDIDLYDENYRFNYAADAWRPDTPEQNRSRDRSSNDKFGLSEGDFNRLRELNPSITSRHFILNENPNLLINYQAKSGQMLTVPLYQTAQYQNYNFVIKAHKLSRYNEKDTIALKTAVKKIKKLYAHPVFYTYLQQHKEKTKY